MKHLFWVSPFLFLLVLFQMSFLVHFTPQGWVPNLVVLVVVLISVLEKPESFVSLIAALFGGFLLDIFSGWFFGFWPLVLMATSFLIKVLVEDYVRFPIPKKF